MANQISVPRDWEVNSSAFRSIGYHPESNILSVEFKTGGVHHHYNVPADIAAEFQAAPSMGSYYHLNIRGKFSTERVNAETSDGQGVPVPQ